MNIISRKDAKAAGLNYYYTGKECKYGHLDSRRVDNHCCNECARIRRREYIKKNPEKIKADNQKRCYPGKRREAALDYAKKYRENNKAETAKKWQLYYQANRKELIEKKKEYARNNRDKVLVWSKNRRSSPQGKAIEFMRRQVHLLLDYKESSSEDILGYSREELASHLERQFTKGMTWDNYGEWHIDHITAVSTMVKKGETRPDVVNCLTNLRPMWASANISKGARSTHLI